MHQCHPSRGQRDKCHSFILGLGSEFDGSGRRSFLANQEIEAGKPSRKNCGDFDGAKPACYEFRTNTGDAHKNNRALAVDLLAESAGSRLIYQGEKLVRNS
jgi:hypothetical protein